MSLTLRSFLGLVFLIIRTQHRLYVYLTDNVFVFASADKEKSGISGQEYDQVRCRSKRFPGLLLSLRLVVPYAVVSYQVGLV